MSAEARERKLNYVNTMFPNSAKRLGMFFFQEFFVDLVKDVPNMRFNFELRKEAKDPETGELQKIEDVLDLDYWRDFWGSGFHIVWVDKKDDVSSIQEEEFENP